MKIGILGGGNVGSALGVAWTRKGHEVMFGVRKPDSPEMKAVLIETGGKARAGSAEEAAQFGEVVVNALPWPATRTVLGSLSSLSGKVLLDCSNPFKPDLSGMDTDSVSGGELVAGWARGAKVVKIFNSTGSANMENPVYAGKAIPMFYCGDDAAAKKTAAQLATDVGFDPIDVGALANSGMLESHALLWVTLAFRAGMGTEFAFQLLRR